LDRIGETLSIDSKPPDPPLLLYEKIPKLESYGDSSSTESVKYNQRPHIRKHKLFEGGLEGGLGNFK